MHLYLHFHARKKYFLSISNPPEKGRNKVLPEPDPKHIGAYTQQKTPIVGEYCAAKITPPRERRGATITPSITTLTLTWGKGKCQHAARVLLKAAESRHGEGAAEPL